MLKRKKQQSNFDYDRLAQAIVKAQDKTDKETIKQAVIDANDEQKRQEKDELKAKQKEWEKTLNADSDVKMFFKILTLKKKDAKTIAANAAIMKMSIVILYWIFEHLIYLLTIGFVILAIVEKTAISIGIAAFFLVVGILIARIIRIARFEVDNINDKKYLSTLFSSMLSLATVIIAAVSFLVTQK